MSVRALLAGACCASLLAACALVDPVDSRYDTVSRSLARARNEAIFLNLVRASHDYPLSFTTIANVTPTMTNNTAFGLPTFMEGPGKIVGTTALFPSSSPWRDVIFNSSTASNTTSVGTNFNISTQETSQFYLGFLKPIDLQTLNYFIRQGYSRELLFWLFADSFQLQYGPSPLKVLGYKYDPPDSYGCPPEDTQHRCFREWIWIALLSGLTVEEKSIIRESGRSGAAGGRGGGASPATARAETVVVARFCFSPELARQAKYQMGPAFAAEVQVKYQLTGLPSPVCGTWTDEQAKEFSSQPQSDTFDFKVGGRTFRVVSRSAYGVFQFLGNLMKIQRDNIEPTPGKAFFWTSGIHEEDEALVPPELKSVNGHPPLLTILQNAGANCFAHTWFFDGDYCVPEEAASTKQIFSLLAQLIAVQTAAGDLSITPVVRVVQ